MRTPGSVNWKDPENPVPVRCFAYDGKPMTAEQIHAALDAAGIPEDPEKKRREEATTRREEAEGRHAAALRGQCGDDAG